MAALAIVPTVAFASANIAKGTALIEKIGQGKIKVTKTFIGPAGMVGYVVVPAGSKRGTVVFTNDAGTYMFAGNIFGANGQNLSQGYNQKYVMGPLSQAAHASVAKMNWFQEGKNSAPHKAYIALDPNCIYCHLLYDRVEPLIAKGELQVRWVPVGVIKATSKGKAAAMLLPSSDKARVAILKKDEAAFKLKTEEGGVKPLDQHSSNVAVKAAFKKVEENNVLFTQYQFVGTPVLLYLDQSGKPAVYPGYPRGAALTQLIPQIGNKW